MSRSEEVQKPRAGRRIQISSCKEGSRGVKIRFRRLRKCKEAYWSVPGSRFSDHNSYTQYTFIAANMSVLVDSAIQLCLQLVAGCI